MSARLAGVVVGVWLMAAPTVLGYGGAAETNDRIVGPIAASLAFVAVWPVLRPLRWTIAPLAAWLLVAPPILGYEGGAEIISTELSGVILAVTVPFGRSDQPFGGGWQAVWSKRPVESG